MLLATVKNINVKPDGEEYDIVVILENGVHGVRAGN